MGQQLAESEGNILENTVLLNVLAETKTKSQDISTALSKSQEMQIHLDSQRDVYRPFAKLGAVIYFLMQDLQRVNHMYQFNLAALIRIFNAALADTVGVAGVEGTPVEMRLRSLGTLLKKKVFAFVSRALFKADVLMFGMHYVHGIHVGMGNLRAAVAGNNATGVGPDDSLVIDPMSAFGENEFEVFKGTYVDSGTSGGSPSSPGGAGLGGNSVPRWVPPERKQAYQTLVSSLPKLEAAAQLSSDLWDSWLESLKPEDPSQWPIKQSGYTPFQRLLVVQALRPDRLVTAMEAFVSAMLCIPSVKPDAQTLETLFKTESLPSLPILMVTTPGADPSAELEEYAKAVFGGNHHGGRTTNFVSMAMGGGNSDLALQHIREAVRTGGWVYLKNLHLVTGWLGQLEKELNALTADIPPTSSFRLWLTTEEHPRFAPVLLQQSVKVTFEAPPGLKKNLQRTFDMWEPDVISGASSTGSGGSSIVRAQVLFVLAWFHAVVQERRTYIPQGWSKFYEFTSADLRAAVDILDSSAGVAQGQPDWTTIHGLLGLAIYGGRIDNAQDERLLHAYL